MFPTPSKARLTKLCMPLKWLSTGALALAAGTALAGGITIRDAYTFPTPAPGAPAAGFLVIDNSGGADRLLSVDSPSAAPVEIHEMSMTGGVMKMRALGDGLPVPSKGTVALQPGGYHLMLFNPAQPVQAGDRIKLTLHFAKAGVVQTELVARKRE